MHIFVYFTGDGQLIAPQHLSVYRGLQGSRQSQERETVLASSDLFQKRLRSANNRDLETAV